LANSFYLDASAQMVHASNICKGSVTRRLVTTSFPLIVSHSINSTDALTLKLGP